MIHWPGGIGTSLRGKALPDVVTALDLLPTFAEAADAALPADREIDGLSLVSRLRGKSSALPDRTHFWRRFRRKPSARATGNSIKQTVPATPNSTTWQPISRRRRI